MLEEKEKKERKSVGYKKANSTCMPVGRHMACPRMLKIVSLSSSLVVAGSSSSISFFSPGRRGNPSPWLERKKINQEKYSYHMQFMGLMGLEIQDHIMQSNATPPLQHHYQHYQFYSGRVLLDHTGEAPSW